MLEILALAEELDLPNWIAETLIRLGRLARSEGGHEEANSLFERALATARGTEPLGRKHRGGAEHSKALDHHREALRLFREFGNKRGIRESLQALGALAAASGRPREAGRLLGTAEASFEATGAVIPPILVRVREEAAAHIRLELSLEELEAEWEKGRAMPADEAVDYALSEDLVSP